MAKHMGFLDILYLRIRSFFVEISKPIFFILALTFFIVVACDVVVFVTYSLISSNPLAFLMCFGLIVFTIKIVKWQLCVPVASTPQLETVEMSFPLRP